MITEDHDVMDEVVHDLASDGVDESPWNPENRARFAANNRRRELVKKQATLTTIVFGVLGYCAVSNIVASLILMPGSKTVGTAFISLLLGGAFAYVTYRFWFERNVSPWLVAAPMLVVVFVTGFWGFKIIPFALNFVGLIALDRLRDVQRKLATLTAENP
jgi:hypothetical protein